MSEMAERINRVSIPLPILLLAGTVVFVALAYHKTLSGLIALWLFSDTVDYSHGILLLALSLGLAGYTIWRNPDLFQLRPTFYGMAILILTAAAWGISSLLFVEVGARLSFWMLFPALVLALFGWEGIRQLWLPLSLPLFGIPVWSVFNEMLRLGTANVVDWTLSVIGVTTLLEGSTITLTMGKFYIADNCTGIRQLVVAMPLALLFAGWNQLRLLPATAIFLAVVALSFVLNVVRILVVVISGILTDMQHYFVTEDHVGLGWALFGLGMFLFFYGTSRILPQGWAVLETGDIRHKVSIRAESTKLVPFLVVTVIVLLVPTSVSRLLTAPDFGGTQALSLPQKLGVWKAAASSTESEVDGVFTGADEVTRRSYSDKNNVLVYVEIALYRFQEAGREAVGWSNSPFNSRYWRFLKDDNIKISDESAITPVRELTVVSATGQRRLVWTWYRVADRESGSSLGAKLLGLRGLLCGRTDASMIVITHDAALPLEKGREAMHRFLVDAKGALMQQLDLAVKQESSIRWCS